MKCIFLFDDDDGGGGLSSLVAVSQARNHSNHTVFARLHAEYVRNNAGRAWCMWEYVGHVALCMKPWKYILWYLFGASIRWLLTFPINIFACWCSVCSALLLSRVRSLAPAIRGICANRMFSFHFFFFRKFKNERMNEVLCLRRW